VEDAAASNPLRANHQQPLCCRVARLVEKFPNAKPARGLTEYDHFLAMCFGQLTYRESLRDIVACLGAKPNCFITWDSAAALPHQSGLRQQASGLAALPGHCRNPHAPGGGFVSE